MGNRKMRLLTGLIGKLRQLLNSVRAFFNCEGMQVMKKHSLKLFVTIFGVLAMISTPVSAQLLGGAGGSAAQAQAAAQQRVQAQAQARAQAQAQATAQQRVQEQAQQRAQAQIQAQTQQRVQAQAQQRAQTQMQAQVTAQVQSRVQVEAARAANIAVRATVAAQQQASAAARSQSANARQRAAGGLNLRLGANTRVNSSNQVRVGNTRANSNANAYSRLGIDTKLALPPGITKTDVQIYDNIFGRFNPLRAESTTKVTGTATAVTSVGHSRTAPPANEDSQESSDSSRARRSTSDLLVETSGDVSLMSRIGVAARQRRAEISQVRDQALASSDTSLMLRAQKMDDALKAFVQAQASASAKARTASQQSPPAVPQSQIQSQGSARGNVRGSATQRN